MSTPSPSRPSLDPGVDEMRRIGYAAVDRVVEHLAGLAELPVARRGTAAEFAALVDEPLPAEGRGLDDSLAFFFERVVPRMTHVSHPRFHAYVPCPGSFAGAIGAWLAAGTNPFAGSWLGGATLASLELTVLRWIAELVGYPSDAEGILTSGGSMANLAALAAARARRTPHEAARVFVSEEGHASVDKAASILGVPASCVVRVPVDARLRMRPDALRELLDAEREAGRAPLAVCANAGTTNTGAIDPLDEIADVCRAFDVWFHVDGAYGGFAALADEARERLAGMARADSLTLDPHKWLYAPMGTGCVLVRHRNALRSAFSAQGYYLRDLPPDEVNFLDFGPELSRRARALPVWTLLRSVGRTALAEQIATDLRFARLAAALLADDPRFEIVDPPQLSVVAFRHVARDGEGEDERAARDVELMERTLADGTSMLSSTIVAGRSALRLVVMNHRTTEADVRLTVRRVRELAP
jgi:glutamate/tyrosine decarboxylase-like PLP-dependent enzyme